MRLFIKEEHWTIVVDSVGELWKVYWFVPGRCAWVPVSWEPRKTPEIELAREQAKRFAQERIVFDRTKEWYDAGVITQEEQKAMRKAASDHLEEVLNWKQMFKKG